VATAIVPLADEHLDGAAALLAAATDVPHQLLGCGVFRTLGDDDQRPCVVRWVASPPF
jgi:hypothetical protein